LARKYFEPIPAQAAPPAVDISQPPQDAERRLDIADPLARLPRLDISYRVPSSVSPDDDAIDVLALVVAGGRSSRFYERVVRQQQLAVSVNAGAPNSRGPRLFRITATPAPGKSIQELESAIYAEIDRVKTAPIEDWEMEKARNSSRRAFVAMLATSLSRAIGLAEYALVYDDPGQINTRWQRIGKLTAGDIQRVAREYLVAAARSVIVTRPQASAGRGGL
jgi:predicted Zn-dependent peptidase